MKKDYEHNNHQKYKMRYHLIFSTKYRKKCLGYIYEDLKQSLNRAENMQNDWRIELMEVDLKLCDHIHFLIRGTPNTRISDVVHKLKQISTYDMWKKYNSYLKQFYWSGKHVLWTKGYFCSSIGEVSEETLRKYIENQG